MKNNQRGNQRISQKQRRKDSQRAFGAGGTLTQAAGYERNEAHNGYHRGHYDRNFTTTSGNVTLHVPRLKGVSFETAIIKRLNREIHRRTRVVSCFPGVNAAVMLVCARLRHVAGTQWKTKVYEHKAFGGVTGRRFHCRIIYIHRFCNYFAHNS